MIFTYDVTCVFILAVDCCCYARIVFFFFFFFKQKTAYEMRISDWSSDVCSSDLTARAQARGPDSFRSQAPARGCDRAGSIPPGDRAQGFSPCPPFPCPPSRGPSCRRRDKAGRSEEHTSELQSLMRI